ncbi:Protein BYPASS-related protein [Dioscorea alata]|uniref:Protein BYPASS-related protein n=1 Tax=Dioscorea alata TaxID=55571 RepID=A0ACB7WUH4_DIOAL|nr:Protein BYPASS-related protein [Dioscorea alata]
MDSSSSSSSTSTPRRHHHHHHHRRRTFLSFRRNQIVSMDQTTDHDFQTLDHFHSLISHNLLSLLPSSSSSSSSSQSSSSSHHHHLLSIPFLSKLLQSLLSFQSHFQSQLHQSLISNPPLLSRPPLDRLLSDHLDRTVKSLDILNTITQSLSSLRHSHRQADIAASALLHHPPNLIRAKTALSKLFTDDYHRATSFTHGLSFSTNRCCVDTGSALGLAVQNMNSIMAFCMWTLMAAFGVVGGPLRLEIESLVGLQDRIWEEVKKKKKGRSGGVLVELEEVERCGKALMEEMEVEVEEELGKKAMEFGEACEKLGGGLGEFERVLREVFHRIVRSRVEVQHFLDQSSRASS